MNSIFPDDRVPSFDPIKRANLSPQQGALMEPLLGVISTLEDKNDKVVMLRIDFWMAAQIISRMFNSNGSAKTPREIIDACIAHRPTWTTRR